MVNIFFDFDGTLIDSRQRLYKLFMTLIPEAGFSFDEYWRIKRNRINQKDMLTKYFGFDAEKISWFKGEWLAHVEDADLLALDRPFDGVTEFLKKMSVFRIYLVTARQSEEKALNQLKNFGWTELFDDILVTKQKDTKTGLISARGLNGQDGIFIGDTGEDVMTGKELGMRTVAVTSGFLCREILEEYTPDYIIDSVVQLNEVCSLQF